MPNQPVSIEEQNNAVANPVTDTKPIMDINWE